MSITDFICWLDDWLLDILGFCDDDDDDDDRRRKKKPRPTRAPTVKPGTGPTPAPTPAPKPDPLWEEGRFMPRCKPRDSGSYYVWCSRYADAKSPRDKLSSGTMFCSATNCTYDFFYGDEPSEINDLVYTKTCNGTSEDRRVTMTADQLRMFNVRCDEFQPGSFPIWAIVLIVLSILAALITIGAIFWNRRQQKRELQMRSAYTLRGVSSTGTPISATPTQRSSLPAVSRLASAQSRGAIGSEGSQPTIESGHSTPGVVPQSSFNRLTVSKMRGAPASSRRLSSVLSTNSHSRSRSRSRSTSGSAGRPKRLGASASGAPKA